MKLLSKPIAVGSVQGPCGDTNAHGERHNWVDFEASFDPSSGMCFFITSNLAQYGVLDLFYLPIW